MADSESGGLTEARPRRLSKARRKALEWIRDREPVGSFTPDAPALWFVKKLCDMGLVERCGKAPGSGFMAFTLFQLTPAGRLALNTDQDTGGRRGG